MRSQKSIYQKSREKAGLTRKQASEKIVYLSENQLEKMERNKSAIDPHDVLAMEEAYGDYTLSSCHCAMHCAIGQKYDKAVELYSLAQIIVHAELAYTQLEGDRQRLLQLGAAKSITAEEAEFLKESSQRMKDPRSGRPGARTLAEDEADPERGGVSAVQKNLRNTDPVQSTNRRFRTIRRFVFLTGKFWIQFPAD
ncbi:helix-turn-helix transcriptional regulator [Allobaculum sp. Allo2]|nr:helix-turn-helix transcriptional regulator [Allobaculum sp. Allo2]